MITQNKGEWSELYVFLKLLGDGVLFAADADLNKNENLYYPVIEILRKENGQKKYYIKDGSNIKITDENHNLILSLPAEEFKAKAKLMLDTIKESKGTFSIPTIEEFMQVIKCTRVKTDSKNKSDTTLVLHDCKTYRDEFFGFSIKSRLGGAPTLLNSSKATNFVYEILGSLNDLQINEINTINSKSKVRDRLAKLEEFGCGLRFFKVENEIFNANLLMIDSLFPLIISEFLLQYYLGKECYINKLTPLIREINPCNFNIELQHHYYEHKIKNFLTAALGMNAATPWDGNLQATGGYIIVKEDGEALCYHMYNHNESQEYLFNNTRLETPSTSKHDFGYVYKENGKTYLKLNLQVRFI